MISTYSMLTKPGIIVGNIITMAAGFALASKGHFNLGLFLGTVVGLALIMASACVFNNYTDREMDKKMIRTQSRALAIGLISIRQAIIFAVFLGSLGAFTLALSTNLLTLFIALTGFFVYVVIYAIWKYRSSYATVIGSIAGGVPPVVGYCAVSNHFDLGAVLLFMIIVLWQMPHFFAIAMYRFEDYAAAAIPVLPVEKGIYHTKVQMVFYIIAFAIAASLPTFFGYTGYAYLAVAALLSLSWLLLCLKGFKSGNDQLWARRMFLFSLVVVTVLCSMIALDR